MDRRSEPAPPDSPLPVRRQRSANNGLPVCHVSTNGDDGNPRWAGLNLHCQARSVSSCRLCCCGAFCVCVLQVQRSPVTVSSAFLSRTLGRQEPFIEPADATFDTSLPPRAARSGRRFISRPSESIKPCVCAFLFVVREGFNSGMFFLKGEKEEPK